MKKLLRKIKDNFPAVFFVLICVYFLVDHFKGRGFLWRAGLNQEVFFLVFMTIIFLVSPIFIKLNNEKLYRDLLFPFAVLGIIIYVIFDFPAVLKILIVFSTLLTGLLLTYSIMEKYEREA